MPVNPDAYARPSGANIVSTLLHICLFCMLLAIAWSKKAWWCILFLVVPWAHSYLMTIVVYASLSVGLALHRADQLLGEGVAHVLVLRLVTHRGISCCPLTAC